MAYAPLSIYSLALGASTPSSPPAYVSRSLVYNPTQSAMWAKFLSVSSLPPSAALDLKEKKDLDSEGIGGVEIKAKAARLSSKEEILCPWEPCEFKSSDKRLLGTHLLEMHQMKDRKALIEKNHFKKAGKIQVLCCLIPECGKKYTRLADLKIHLIQIHQVSTRFLKGFLFKVTNKDDKPFGCPEPKCLSGFNCFEQLEGHIHRMHPSNPHTSPYGSILCPWDTCAFETVNRKELGLHLLDIHKMARPLIEKKHLGIQNTESHSFTCPMVPCRHKFKKVYSLRKHLIDLHQASTRYLNGLLINTLDSDEKPFPCQETGCIASFTSQSRLKKHIRNKHS